MSDISKRYEAVLHIAKAARGRRLASFKPKPPDANLPDVPLEAMEHNAPVGEAANLGIGMKQRPGTPPEGGEEDLEAALVDYERTQHGGRIPTVDEERAEGEKKKRGMKY